MRRLKRASTVIVTWTCVEKHVKPEISAGHLQQAPTALRRVKPRVKAGLFHVCSLMLAAPSTIKQKANIMAQSTVLALGTASGTSSDIVVASGAQAVVGMFVGGSDALNGVLIPLRVVQVTPGNVNSICNLDSSNPSVLLLGPNTYRVVRSISPVPVGVFIEV